jgi:hypothetical protein
MSDRTIIVDFDGVLYSYASGWKGVDVLPDPPVENALEWLDQISDDFLVAVLSTRSHQEGGIDAMRAWILKHGATHTRLDRKISEGRVFFPAEKVPALLSIDDRAWRFDGPGTFPSAEDIRAFEPWFRRDGIVLRGRLLERTIDILDGTLLELARQFGRDVVSKAHAKVLRERFPEVAAGILADLASGKAVIAPRGGGS